jgi:hypothetical protein
MQHCIERRDVVTRAAGVPFAAALAAPPPPRLTEEVRT